MFVLIYFVIKMMFSVCFISLITILSKTYSLDSKPVPGISGCSYFGSLPETCGETLVPVTDLPKECSSFFYFDIKADPCFNVDWVYPNINNDEYIKSLICSGKPTFLYYGHENGRAWLDAVSCNLQNGGLNAKTEMANLKKFLEPYPDIAGLVIEHLTIEPNVTDLNCFTDNFKIYIDEMKKTFPNYSIGIEIFGQGLVDFQDQSNIPEWLDFTVLDPVIDFYIINFYKLNECSDEFKVGGTFPITGSAFYTIEIVTGFVQIREIPKEKTYFMYKSGPSAVKKPDFSVCNVTNAKLCVSPSLDGYCADNTQTFFDKGKYAQDNGAGFIAMDLDLLDDPYSCCQCGTKFPAFHDMLAGFNNCSAPPACPLLDKN